MIEWHVMLSKDYYNIERYLSVWMCCFLYMSFILKIVWTIKMYGCSIVEYDFRLWYLWLVIFIGLKWLKNSYVWTMVKMNTNWYLFSFPFRLGWSKRHKRNRFKVYGEFVIEVWQNVIVKMYIGWLVISLFIFLLWE